jgi:RNA polymerase sigma-70 factor, ECF subfamily
VELALDYSLARRDSRDQAARAVAGERTGRRRFEELLHRHHAMLRRAAAGVVGRGDAVDDVLQEAYLKAYRNLPRSFASDAHEAAWLYRVVYNCCLDELKRRKRRDAPGLDPELAAARAGDPLDPVAVQAALRCLSAQDRAVLFLVDYAGLGYDAAADVLAVPRGTVASRLNVARSRFRSSFGDADA